MFEISQVDARPHPHKQDSVSSLSPLLLMLMSSGPVLHEPNMKAELGYKLYVQMVSYCPRATTGNVRDWDA